jgi:capsular polysaccharide export protein
MPPPEATLPGRPGAHPSVIYAVGFSGWKRSTVRAALRTRVVFVDDAGRVPPDSTCAAWGCQEIPGPVAEGIKLLRIEDGFLRSIGLGSDLIRPISLVIDRRGMYYDATAPSALEELLGSAEFTPALTQRARALRERLVTSGLTKYNVGSSTWKRPPFLRRVLLVPGQVETDASLKFGAPGIRTNLELLQAVRAANPDAFLIYKPHPDVQAGLRVRSAAEDRAPEWCNLVLMDVPMADLLSQVDEVHVMTSLAGFEALLRGRLVRCYGQPFYAGWGLTCDVHPVQRRTRRLTLDELVAGTLILYPTYVSRSSGKIISIEQALDELLDWRARGDLPWLWRGIVRSIVRRVVGVR